MIAASNGHRSATAVWRTATVQAFFTQMSWEGVSQRERFELSADAPASPPLLQQTVGAFFQRFPWEGIPEIAAPVLPLSAQSSVT
ncbi:MAG: hypothetical protein HC812_15365, partial [Leptolyngbya sp. RL_3_1]|nr:hypothetical protein [Leptolyngbya sp. RL_3_1]